MYDPTKLDLYNKQVKDQVAGTLVGNWWEERELRQFTNVGRNAPLHHITKSRANLYLAAPEEISVVNPNIQVNTAEKILGERKHQEFSQTNNTYGQEKNKSQFIQKQGQKYQHELQANLLQFHHDYKLKEQKYRDLDNKRYFDTTFRTEFTQKEFQSEIGKTIMKDQNYQPCLQNKNDLYYQEFNRILKPNISENINVNQFQDYLTHVPATFYEEKKNLGTYFKSQGESFGLNNSFVKSYTDYKQIKL